MHYVYFITDGEYIKIGISNNVKSRLSGLQTSNPKKLSLLSSIECPDSTYAGELERTLHERFSESRASGEWFKLDWETVQKKLGDTQQIVPIERREIPMPVRTIRTTQQEDNERVFTRRTGSEITQIRFNRLIEVDLADNYPPMKHFPNLGTDVLRPSRFMPKQWKQLQDPPTKISGLERTKP
jgi:Meiotically Up-regulated Gene 113 (MUG113) protein